MRDGWVSKRAQKMNGEPKPNIFSDQELFRFFQKCASLGLDPLDSSLLDEKYKFVVQIKKQLESLVASDVNQDIDQILSSVEYTELLSRLLDDAEQACKEFSEIRIVQRDESILESSGKSESWSVGSIVSGLCPHIDELESILIKLGPSKSQPVRLDGANLLNSFSVGDLLSEEYWDLSKKCMERLMVDPDIHIAKLGLSLYSRSLQLAPQYLLPQVFISYVKQLQTLLSIDPDFDCLDPRIELRLRQFRLLKQAMMRIPSSWSRFPVNSLNELMECTIELLFESKNGLGWISLVDPHCQWFQEWISSHLGCSHLLTFFEQYAVLPNLIQKFLSFKSKYRKSCSNHVIDNEYTNQLVQTNNMAHTSGSIQIQTADKQYLEWLHIISILASVIVTKVGRKFFPVDVDVTPTQLQSTYSINNFITDIISLASKDYKLFYDDGSIKFWKFRIRRFCIDILDRFTKVQESQEYLRCSEYVKLVIEPFKSSSRTDTDELELEKILKSLLMFSTVTKSRDWLMNGIAEEDDIVNVVVKFVSDWCEGMVQLPEKTIYGLLSFLENLYKNFEGLPYITKHNLHYKLAERRNGVDVDCKDLLDQKLIAFSTTPKGLRLLEETGSLDFCVSWISKQCLEQRQLSQCQSLKHWEYISRILLSMRGCQSLSKTGLVESMVKEVWRILDCEEVFGSQTFDPPDNVELMRLVHELGKLLTNFNFMPNCLNRDSFKEMVNVLVFLSKQRELLAFEESRKLGLCLFKHMVHDLDSLILLQQDFQFIQRFFAFQRECFIQPVGEEKTVFVMDSHSVLVNYILLYSLIIGGPNEKIMPPVNLNCFEKEYSHWVFSNEIPTSVQVPVTLPQRLHPELRLKVSRCKTISELKAVYQEMVCSPIHFDDSVLIINTIVNLYAGQSHTIVARELSNYEKIGIDIAKKYASRFLCPVEMEGYGKTLTKILRQMKSDTDTFSGFDWFIATFVLMFKGSEKVKDVMETLTTIPGIHYIWPQLGKDDGARLNMCHYAESIISQEFPMIYSVFRQENYPLSLIFKKWTKQVFWNVLDIEGIQRYLLTCLLYGNAFQVYFCVSIIHQNKERILQCHRNGEFLELVEDSWHSSVDLGYMLYLEEKYAVELH